MTATTAWKFTGADGNLLVGDQWGDPPAAVMFHGGGQTRHAWGQAAWLFTEAGLPALNVDLRGHGDSEWERHGCYAFTDHARDVTKIVSDIASRSSWSAPPWAAWYPWSPPGTCPS